MTILQEELKAIILRVINGELPDLPPAPRLPVDKSDFPKLLALDLNKCVELGRCFHGRPHDAASKAALEAIQIATKSGKLVVHRAFRFIELRLGLFE